MDTDMIIGLAIIGAVMLAMVWCIVELTRDHVAFVRERREWNLRHPPRTSIKRPAG